MNYSPEQTESIINAYTENPTEETVIALAKKYGRKKRSIIGKLAKEGVYRRREYRSKTGEKPITKLEITQIICDRLEGNENKLAGLEKTPKLALKYLEELVDLRLSEMERELRKLQDLNKSE